MVQLHLELDLDPNDPVAGSLRGDDGVEQGFTGWLELLAALETACASARDDRASG